MPVLLIVLMLPLVEIALFIVVGGWIGVWPTLALVAGAGVAGVAVMRRTGLSAARRMRMGGPLIAALMPVAEDAARLLAGLLLILPGFLTDVVALALLVPPVRRAAIAWLAARVVPVRPPTPARHAIIDGEYVDLDDDARERDRERDDDGAPPHLTRH